MEIASLIPAPDALPVHWLWLQLLLTLTTFLHLVAMNLMLGSGIIALVTPYRLDGEIVALRRDIARTLPFTIALTINLGVAPLLFIQVLFGQFFYTSSVLMASLWLTLVGLLIVGYYAAYMFTMRYKALGKSQLWLGIAVLFLALVGFIFTNNLSLMQQPASWSAWFANRSGWLINLSDTALLPRYLHFLTSAVAIGGLGVAFYYEMRKRRGDNSGEKWRRRGCNWFSYANIVNFPIGFWFLGFIPASAYDGSTWSGRLFILLLAATFIGIAKAIIAAQRCFVIPTTCWALATIFFMTLARDLLRFDYLRDYFSPAALPVQAQYSPLLLFLLLAAVMGWLIVWLLKAAGRTEVNR